MTTPKKTSTADEKKQVICDVVDAARAVAALKHNAGIPIAPKVHSEVMKTLRDALNRMDTMPL